MSATPQCGTVQRKVHWSGSCASDALADLSEHSALQLTLKVLCVCVCVCVWVTCENKREQMMSRVKHGETLEVHHFCGAKRHLRSQDQV